MPQHYQLSMLDVGQKLGLDIETARDTFNYLRDAGFIKSTGICGKITLSGIKKVEEAMEHPQNSIQNFPAMIVNNYTIKQAGAVGTNSHAHNMILNQTSVEALENTDINQLTEELSKLRKAMKESAIDSEPQVDIAIGEIAKAEQAAKEGDRTKVSNHLKNAGQWAFDVATKIGTTLAADLIKESLF